MKSSFHAGVSGLMAYQQMMDTIGNNIANVNTAGYKHQTTNFEDLLYVHMNTKSAPDLLKGVGTKAASTQLHADQGAFLNTGARLDFAISGDGFFAIDNEGQREYTRNGAFTIGLRNRRAYLTTADGAYVLDMRGRRIELEEVGGAGLYDYDALTEQIGIYRFANPHALSPLSSTRYLETEESGGGTRDSRGVNALAQGFLEQSGTNLTDAMAGMIRAQRAYQVSARVVSTADQIEEIVNSLRR
ncbi:MAG: flagellar hook-basal body protein [Clostridiales bacterium]|nr:flagellar hook-basal body protein [Clostridiales bacterium]